MLSREMGTHRRPLLAVELGIGILIRSDLPRAEEAKDLARQFSLVDHCPN